MEIKNSVKKKFLNEYKNTLIYTPYDEFLIEIYENSRPRFRESKNGKLVLAKRKKYDKNWRKSNFNRNYFFIHDF